MDILTLNKDDFNNYNKDIYLAEFSSNKTNIDNKECLFLDLSIPINDGKLNKKLILKND